ncbi:hypothetical protein [Streptomyces sp. NPDC047000]|uniref:hypothetical protein n=1 Tax=Streptomyces sp. NPDC047000 TaxID=3155474 RepID=UPI0034048CB3
MSLHTADLIAYIAGFTVGVLLIGQGLLRWLGVDLAVRRDRAAQPVSVRNSVLAGVGICLMTAGRIPTGHRLVWDLLLTLPGTVMFAWGMGLMVGLLRGRGAH